MEVRGGVLSGKGGEAEMPPESYFVYLTDCEFGEDHEKKGFS